MGVPQTNAGEVLILNGTRLVASRRRGYRDRPRSAGQWPHLGVVVTRVALTPVTLVVAEVGQDQIQAVALVKLDDAVAVAAEELVMVK